MSNDKIKEELDKVLGGVIDDCILDDVIAIFKPTEERPAEPEVLMPYNYKGECGYYISWNGEITHGAILCSTELFAGTEAELKPVQQKLKAMSLVQALKKSAGCAEYDFIEGEENYYIGFNHVRNKWDLHMELSRCHELVIAYLPKEHKDAIFAGFVAAVERGAL